MGLQWRDFNWEDLTVLIRRGVVNGRAGDTKTEASQKPLPIDPRLARSLEELWKRSLYKSPQDWVFSNRVGRPRAQQDILGRHLRSAGLRAGIGKIGWHTFRHSYRSWLDDTGTPLTVQKELMRHASIQTTMNIYGKAMTDSKRQAHSKVVEMVLKGSKPSEKTLISAIGS